MNQTAIEWADRVWNPVTGCSKVSAGCANCYAEAISLRFKRSVGPWNAVNAPENVILHPERLMMPLSLEKPQRIFVNSMSDLFHELVPDAFIDQVFAIMAATPHLTYLVLTKRPERMAAYINGVVVDGKLREGILGSLVTATGGDLTGRGVHPFWMIQIAWKGWPWPLPNVWLGTSTEDQRTADERIPHLLATPAAVRFLSCEPLLGPIDILPWVTTFCDREIGECCWLNHRGRCEGCVLKPENLPLHWVIAGGESGPKHRPMDLDWARSLRDQCQAAGVAYFFKQVGGRTPKSGGSLLDGREWKQFPEARVAGAV